MELNRVMSSSFPPCHFFLHIILDRVCQSEIQSFFYYVIQNCARKEEKQKKKEKEEWKGLVIDATSEYFRVWLIYKKGVVVLSKFLVISDVF